MNNGKKMMKLVAVVLYGPENNRKSKWTTIGVAFENRDASFNLRFDYLPTDMTGTTIQMRAFDPRSDEEGQPSS
jgi:hypothetical protein